MREKNVRFLTKKVGKKELSIVYIRKGSMRFVLYCSKSGPAEFKDVQVNLRQAN